MIGTEKLPALTEASASVLFLRVHYELLPPALKGGLC